MSRVMSGTMCCGNNVGSMSWSMGCGNNMGSMSWSMCRDKMGVRHTISWFWNMMDNWLRHSISCYRFMMGNSMIEYCWAMSWSRSNRVKVKPMFRNW